MAGSLAAKVREPRQVRKEATVSGSLRVPRECLAGAALWAMPNGFCRREVHGLNSEYQYMRKSVNVSSARVLPGPAASRHQKALGQHFLVDQGVVEQILSAAALGPDDTVLEVGPGRGELTRSLVRIARRVIVVEIDPRLGASLPGRLGYPPNLSVIIADARTVDLGDALEGESHYKMLGNLPYYAAVPIIRQFLESDGLEPTLMVFMVQEEVANSMVAQGGRMSLLAVGMQLYGVPRIVCKVPSSSFRPPPKVSSAVVRIDPRRHPDVERELVNELFEVVKAGFSAPRKQFKNSLSRGMGITTDETGELLEQAGLNPTCRPGNLSIADWWALYEACRERCTGGNQSLRQDKLVAGRPGQPP